MSDLRPVGDRAWLLEGTGADQARGLAAAVLACAPAGLVATRRGGLTVLASFADADAARAAAPVLADLSPLPAEPPAGEPVLLELTYDGDDLSAVAAELGVSTDALVAEHQATVWLADFCGFAPGFAYLSGWQRSVTRLPVPRTRVPAGAVAVAGRFTAAYPSASPGGWRLLGRTAAALWDPDRDPPALIRPGAAVSFAAVRPRLVGGGSVPREPGAAAPGPGGSGSERTGRPAGTSGLRVVDPGPGTVVEDLGRPGLEHLGVPPSGSADVGAARRANRVVGNPRESAVLETLGGLVVQAVGDLVLAVTGADALVGDEKHGPGEAFALPDGDRVTVLVRAGVRGYLAVRGGVASPSVLGSRSFDVLSGLGPAPLVAGAQLEVGPPGGVVGPAEPDPGTVAGPTVVRVVLGPRDDWFARPGDLLDREWTVGAASNRVGLRLTGGTVDRAPGVAGRELESEPMVPGAVQVPGSGEPVVLLRDHPVTGGYPVVAVVVADDLDLLGRLGPGALVRFVPADDRHAAGGG